MHDATELIRGDGNASWIDRYLPGGTGQRAQAPQMIDVATVRGFVWRQRWILVGVTALMLVLGFIVTLLTTPTFQANSVVRVDPEQGDIFEGESLTPSIAVNYLDSYLNTLAAVVESRALAEQVVDALKLDQRPDFLPSASQRPAGVTPENWARQRREMAIVTIRGGVEAKVPPLQRVVEIEYRSSDPRLAAEIANAYADKLLTDDLRRNLQKNVYAQEYLQSEIAAIRTRLDDAQRQALGYARANGIIGEAMLQNGSESSEGAAPQTITAANLASVTGNLSAARAKRIDAEQRWRSVAGTAYTSLPEFQDSAAANSLQAERSKIVAQLAEQSIRYGPDHPQIRELQAQLDTIDRQLGAIGNQIKSALRQEYEIARRQEAALSGELARVSGETLDEQNRRVTFNQLNSNAQAVQTQLTTLLERYNQISASANVRPSTMTVLDRATVPAGPVSPNLLRNLLLAAVLGAGLALALAVVRETLDDRLRSGEDVENKLGIPLLGVTPLLEEGDSVEDSPALAEAHSSIRAAIDFALPRPGHNVILLTSSQSVEGKTTTAVALAGEYARLGRSVLLVDADLRRPSLAKRFGLARPAKGFGEVLAGDVALHDALIENTQTNLDVLPVGAIPPNPVEIVSSYRAREFFEQQRQRYDVILIDSPPVMGLADAPLLSHLADGVVFVVESNRAHFGQAKTALRRLRDAEASIIGVVLTKFRALEAGQSDDYQYAYYTYGQKKGT